MMPSPMNPMCTVSSLRTRSSNQLEALCACADGLVLEPDMPVVGAVGQRAGRPRRSRARRCPADRGRACRRSARARTAPRGRGSTPLDVLAHAGEVVEVGEERDVRTGTRCRSPRTPCADDVIGYRAFSIEFSASITTVAPMRCAAFVASARFSSASSWSVSSARVAVQRVERAAAEPLGEADGHVDVVAEPVRCRRVRRQQAAVATAAMSPASKLRPTSRTPASVDRRRRRVQLRVRWHGSVERPPQLDRVEPGRGRCRRAAPAGAAR